jgi:hypothetical protein
MPCPQYFPSAFFDFLFFFNSYLCLRMLSKKTYLPLLLALLLFIPLLEQARHGFRHLEEVHCKEKAVHVCAKEHSCSLCNYLFASHPSVSPEVYTFAPRFFVVPCMLLCPAETVSDKALQGVRPRGPPAA